MVPQWQPGIIMKIEQATHNTRRFWIELPESPGFTFKPGQFVTLDLPIHPQRNKRWRSYSIASMPGSNIIELLIVHLNGGLATDYLFNQTSVGSTLTLRGPQGIFVLPEMLDKELLMICTGTGIAPFRSMLLHLNTHQIPHQPIHLVFGTRTHEDLLYKDEMQALERSLPGFSFHYTLSREQWAGHMGYVHPIYEQLCAGRQPATFMLCGWKAMIDEAKQRILAMGYEKKDVHSELYG